MDCSVLFVLRYVFSRGSFLNIYLSYLSKKIYIYFINRKSFEVGDVSKVFLWNDVWCPHSLGLISMVSHWN